MPYVGGTNPPNTLALGADKMRKVGATGENENLLLSLVTRMSKIDCLN